MFKFGKYAHAEGDPYNQYRDPTQPAGKKKASVAITGSTQSAKTRVTANGPFNPAASGDPTTSQSNPGANLGGGFGGGNNVDRYNPVFDQLEEGTILEDWIPRDGAGLDLLFTRIYLRDPTIGPGIDILRNLPWSPFTLQGVDDPAILKIYEDTINAMNPELLMPDITGDYLTIGRNIGSLIFNERQGIFQSYLPYDPDFIRVTPIPIYGYDPLCDFKLQPGFRKFLESTDPRAMDYRKSLPPMFLKAAQENNGFLPLDPLTTVYLPRKASQHDSVGTSLLTRCLYFWAIEKALLNAQMATTRRRIRSFTHITAGIDNVWEPLPEELDALAGMIHQANEDPVGGVIATRTGVTISEPLGGGADFYKWSDELELFSKYKMQCIGINEALLNGDSTYNNADQARSVLVEMLATLRSRIVHKFFYQKVFPVTARMHGFVKRTPAELQHRIRTTSAAGPKWAQPSMVTSQRLTQRRSMDVPNQDLIMPTISWAKQLKPNQDDKALDVLEKLKQNDYPVTLQQWASAAGYDPKNIENEVKDDKDLQRKIAGFDASAAGGSGEEHLENEEPGPESDLANEIPVEQSVYSRYKHAGKNPTSLEQVAIWHHGKCGTLTKSEAARVLAKMLKETKPEMRRNPRALRSWVESQVKHDQVEILSYCINRLGLGGLPVSERTAGLLLASARDAVKRHTSFKTEAALMDARRHETEIMSIARIVKASQRWTGATKIDNVKPPGPVNSQTLAGSPDKSE